MKSVRLSFGEQLRQSVNPLVLVRSIRDNGFLIWLMTKREFSARYRGSVLGLMWTVFNPLLLLLVYTFVFTVVFRARFQTGNFATTSGGEFAVMMFTGLVVFSILADTMNRAPLLILSNVNYVKRVMFPLEILTLANLGATLVQAGVSLLILIAAILLIFHTLPATAVFLPLILVPYIFINLGISWFLASLAVFVKDIRHIMGILTTALLFLSPIFYPVEAIPEKLRRFIYLNPMTYIIEETRAVMILGDLPDWKALVWYFLGSLGCMWLGWIWFQMTRKGFADVI